MAIEGQGTLFEIATGTGGAKNITAIALGEFTKITSAAHGFSVGDVVTFASIVGTTALNGESEMITAVGTDYFWINVDSSGYDAWVSGGTATPVAFTEVAEVSDFTGPGGTAAVIDVTHLQSTRKEKMMGVPDEGQFGMTLNLVLDDTGQLACQTARAGRLEKGFRLTYSDDTVQTFNGYVLGFSSSGSVDDKVTASITIEITGAVTTL